jgi:hypothetical protein
LYWFGSPPALESSLQLAVRSGKLDLGEVVLLVEVLRRVPVEDDRLLLLVELAPARHLRRLGARGDELEFSPSASISSLSF